jgi:uncharacterized membrane protein YdbT with pleckstrin-like domain
MRIPRRLLADDERAVLAVRPHGKVLVGPVLVLFVLAPVTVVIAAFVPPGGAARVLRLLVLGAGLLVVVRGSVVPFLAWRRTVYVVTTRRVVVRRGILRRRGRDVSLARVARLSCRTGTWDRPLGCGRLRVEVAGDVVPLVLDDVPAVEQVRRTIQRYAGHLPAAGAPEAGDEPDDEPAAEPTAEPVAEPTAEPVAEPDAGPAEPAAPDDERREPGDDLWPGGPDDAADDVTWRRRGRGARGGRRWRR